MTRAIMRDVVVSGKRVKTVDVILQTPGLSDTDTAAMLGGTAMKLLGIKG